MQPVNVMSTEKSPVRVAGFDDIEFAPRFEYGEMAEVCGADDGSELGVGWGRLRDARIPWTIRYDEGLPYSRVSYVCTRVVKCTNYSH